jgi:hypothetical protein
MLSLSNQPISPSRIAELRHIQKGVNALNGPKNATTTLIDSWLKPQSLSQQMKHLTLKPVTVSPTTRIMLLARSHHFLDTQSINTDQLLIEDLESHGIDAHKVKECSSAWQGRLSELAPFVKLVSSQLEIEPHALVDRLWNDFLLGIDEPIECPMTKRSIQVHRETLAILLGDIALLASLLISKPSVNCRDDTNTTAAHMAAMRLNWPVLVMLRKLGADFSLKTITNATVYDLLSALGFTKTTLPKTIQVFKDTKLSLSDTEHLFGRKYSPHSIHSSLSLVSLWMKKAKETEPNELKGYERNMLSQFLASQKNEPSPIYVREKNDYTPTEGPMKWQICVDRDVKAGRFLFECTGHIKSYKYFEEKCNDIYSQAIPSGLSIDSTEFGNFSEMLTHGVPNCAQKVVLLQGKIHILCFALTDLTKDSPLYTNFGMNYFTCNGFDPIERTSAQLDEFTSQLINFLPLSELIQKSHPHFINDNSLLQLSHYKQARSYLYEFPNYLFEAVASKRLTETDVAVFFESMKHYASESIALENHTYRIIRLRACIPRAPTFPKFLREVEDLFLKSAFE